MNEEKITGTEKEFLDVFRQLCISRSSWQVWADLMAAMACTLANAVDKSLPRHQRQSAKESVQADVEQWYSELNSMESAGRITSAQNKQYHKMTGWYVKGQEGNELSKSLQLGSNTLNSAYAEKIQSNRQSLAENTQYTINTAQSQLEQLLQLEHPEEGNVSALSSALMYGFKELGNGKIAGVGPAIDKDQNALSTMYESMKPDVTQMQGLIDDYREAGKAVPQSLMDSFNDATVDGKTSYGIRQKIVSRGTNDTLDEAKKEAREILADDGKPKEEITIKLPDIPIIRKGDKIHLKTASISAGYYIVISATHDVDKMLMTLGLKKAPAAKKSSGNKKTKAKSYDVGDIVNFHGGKHYVSSYPDARGYSVGAGKAKITIKGGSGKAHPWHLVTQNWNQTHVWGWVDDGSFD